MADALRSGRSRVYPCVSSNLTFGTRTSGGSAPETPAEKSNSPRSVRPTVGDRRQQQYQGALPPETPAEKSNSPRSVRPTVGDRRQQQHQGALPPETPAEMQLRLKR